MSAPAGGATASSGWTGAGPARALPRAVDSPGNAIAMPVSTSTAAFQPTSAQWTSLVSLASAISRARPQAVLVPCTATAAAASAPRSAAASARCRPMTAAARCNAISSAAINTAMPAAAHTVATPVSDSTVAEGLSEVMVRHLAPARRRTVRSP
jgi:hypothetical protein